jgi:hypothetical protein
MMVFRILKKNIFFSSEFTSDGAIINNFTNLKFVIKYLTLWNKEDRQSDIHAHPYELTNGEGCWWCHLMAHIHNNLMKLEGTL